MTAPETRARPAPAKLPRGATWYALWCLPLMALLALIFVPWSQEPAPIFDPVKMKVAADRWKASMARREAASATDAASANTVTVRVIPASAPR